MKLIATQSQLVLVDIQTKLVPVMPADAMQAVIKNAQILLQAAQTLSIPAVATEQYPQGLGATVPALTALLPANKIISKTTFSCCGEQKFNQQLQRDKPHIVLMGMEAHICLLQTALDLTDLTVLKGQISAKQVFVVEDAIVSRNPAHKANAIARMRDAGCIITNAESVLFEWLGDAEHAAFKTLSKLIR